MTTVNIMHFITWTDSH